MKLCFGWNLWLCEKKEKCETWIQALNRCLPHRERFKLVEILKTKQKKSIATQNFANLGTSISIFSVQLKNQQK